MNPIHIAMLAGVVIYSGWVFTQGRHFEQRKQNRAIEAVNKRVKAANEKEEKVAAKEEELRTKAVVAAAPVIAKAGKCVASPDLAAALSNIR